MTVRTVAAISLRELLRRRAALAFVFLLPLVFYLVRIDTHWQAIRFLSIGVGWAMATLALFGHVASRQLDRRLTVVGASPTALFLGRQLALVGVGMTVAAAYFVIVALTQDEVPRLTGVALLLPTTVLISLPLGALVSLLIDRELEGALALLSVMAVQLLVDPAGAATKLLPLWSTRELTGYAVLDDPGTALGSGLGHFAIAFTLCAALAWAASVARLRTVPLRPPTQDSSAGASV